jgi:RimJ/RimL family protein N-acetyltransferase
LDDPNCAFFIALDAEGQPIGQVRFDIDAAEAVISVSLTDRFHGRGYGPEVIRLAVRELLGARPVARVDAYIRTENLRSSRAFLEAGFTEQGTTAVRGHPARLMVWHKERAWDPK